MRDLETNEIVFTTDSAGSVSVTVDDVEVTWMSPYERSYNEIATAVHAMKLLADLLDIRVVERETD